MIFLAKLLIYSGFQSIKLSKCYTIVNGNEDVECLQWPPRG